MIRGSMPLYFSDFITEVPFSDVVPLGRFRRVLDLSGCDINYFHRACDISSRDIILAPSGKLKWCFRVVWSGEDLKS